MSELEPVLDPTYLDGLSDRPMDEVRAMRTTCVDIETGLSYFRRIVQGRIDILDAETRQRSKGGTSGDLSELIGHLPEILTEHRREGSGGRLPQSLEPVEIEPDLAEELERLASISQIAELNHLDDQAVAELRAGLHDLEERVSGLRRQLFGRIDALQDELARRYKSGEASVDSLLQ